MKGIILHGGHGTRLKPLTDSGPKQLIPIANKPMSQYALEDLRDAGIIDIAIIIGDVFPEKVKEYYGDGSKFGVKITYIFQDKPKGISHAIRLCKDFVGSENFIVYLGDNVLRKGLRKLKSKFDKLKSDCFILLVNVSDPSRYGIAEFENNKIIKIVEKPKVTKSNLAVIGVYFFTPKIFDVIDELKPSPRGELEVTDAIQLSLEMNHTVDFELVNGWWKDTGTPHDILDANKLILNTLGETTELINEDNIDIKNKILIGKNVSLSKNANLLGPLIIGNNCKIGSNVTLGPFVDLGDNSNIDNSVIENSILMKNCKLSGKIYLLNSIIGENCQISTDLENYDFILAENSLI